MATDPPTTCLTSRGDGRLSRRTGRPTLTIARRSTPSSRWRPRRTAGASRRGRQHCSTASSGSSARSHTHMSTYAAVAGTGGPPVASRGPEHGPRFPRPPDAAYPLELALVAAPRGRRRRGPRRGSAVDRAGGSPGTRGGPRARPARRQARSLPLEPQAPCAPDGAARLRAARARGDGVCGARRGDRSTPNT